MPLLLGHAAIGLTTHDMCCKNNLAFSWWKVVVFVVVLANLPDIDVVIGLLLQGNGCVFHRGPMARRRNCQNRQFPGSMRIYQEPV